MSRYMSYREVLADFRENVLPMVKAQYEQDGKRDSIARREAFNDHTDALCKDRRITAKQYETWGNPY